MKQEMEQLIALVIKDLFKADVSVELTRVSEQFGDYATNVALQLAAKKGKKPGEIANVLVAKLEDKLKDQVDKISIAGPGFINLTLSNKTLWQLKDAKPVETLKGKTVVAEYSDPNPFKVLHAGHLYTSVVGDAIAKLYEAAGAKVHRVNFGGDVGLHVARTMWAILRELGGEHPEKLSQIDEKKRAEWMSQTYVKGNAAYEENKTAKSEITELNKRLYQITNDNDKTSDLAKIYWTTRAWSYDYFNEFYKLIGSGFEKYYPESEVAALGQKTVEAQLKKGVFKKSDGAVVFEGHKYGLHTRVFINSEGLPTYEAKDTGLILQKWADYHFDISLVITANEIAQYMQVVLKALEQFEPELVTKTIHLTHGLVKLEGGAKMSSRKGNILKATDVLDAAHEANKKLSGKDQPEVVLGAVKYAFLKQGLGADIIYNPSESVAITGNSGPYLQYALVRAQSIIKKSEAKIENANKEFLDSGERALLRKIGEYAEVVDKAIAETAPWHIATYLYELAAGFNSFYEHNRVIGDQRQNLRLNLVEAYAATLKKGLELLNIPAPEKM